MIQLPFNLTKRELQIALLIAEDKPSKEIARLLSISLRTVEVHRCRTLRKTRCRSMIGVTRKLIALGAIYPEWQRLCENSALQQRSQP